MGWFWKDEQSAVITLGPIDALPSTNHESSPPPGCPMHRSSATAMTHPTTHPLPASQSSCPYPSARNDNEFNKPRETTTSRYSKYNPLNYMFSEISQEKAEGQKVNLPLEREVSTIPKGTGHGTWEYPSPQQMYNALLRKGYHDTDVTAVESMVSVHNFLNEGAWGEILEWERRFGKGLARGWHMSKRGEANALITRDAEGDEIQPGLIRFQGRPKDMTPKATMLQVMGWIYPAGFKTDPPFDRHDWYVSRHVNGQTKEIRYIIDYYEGPDEPTGEPVFYLDVRPAVTPTAAVERMMRWGGDVWYRASGGAVREQNKED